MRDGWSGEQDGRVSEDEGYLLDDRQAEAGQRFDALARLLDPVTFRHLDQTGVTTGWRCWEVGAGGVTVPAGLAARVGPADRVLATDIDTSWLPPTSPVSRCAGTTSAPTRRQRARSTSSSPAWSSSTCPPERPRSPR